MSLNLYSLLNSPVVYKAAQVLLAPGGHRLFSSRLAELLAEIDPGQTILDVGCGPASLLASAGIKPIGSDISESYLRSYDGPAVVNSADALPFADRSFDSVWSIALIHHLPDIVAQKSLAEMVRVCRPGGYVVVVDAVLPNTPWAKPIPYVIRKLDRGAFVRGHEHLCNLLQDNLPSPVMKRATMTYNGLEAIWSWSRVL